MAHLASVGSHRINGVAALHTELLKARRAARLPRAVAGEVHERDERRHAAPLPGARQPAARARSSRTRSATAGRATSSGCASSSRSPRTPAFRAEWRAVKRANKADLAAVIEARAGVACDPDSLFDVQVKRIHEYKRQHLNVLHVIALWQRLRREPAGRRSPPRTVVFGGKAAPGYRDGEAHHQAHPLRGRGGERRPGRRATGCASPSSPTTTSRTACRSSRRPSSREQISTAGKEASGTGNMKFAMNGALTIGTLDGANVEIREAVGRRELLPVRPDGRRDPRAAQRRLPAARAATRRDPELRGVIDALADGTFSRGDAALFRPLVDSLLGDDPWLLLADFRSYLECQARVEQAYLDPERWTRHVDPEHGAHGPLLLGPLDRRLLPRRLARRAGADRAVAAASLRALPRGLGRAVYCCKQPRSRAARPPGREGASRCATCSRRESSCRSHSPSVSPLPMAASSAAAKDEAVLRLRAWAVDLNNGARTNTIDIVIERWSTPGGGREAARRS